jgi:HAD superfamily hydrolase (TIGR01549 family)
MGVPDWVVLLDLDDTLVLTSKIQHLRRRGSWRQAYASFSETSLRRGTKTFLQKISHYAHLGIVTTAPRRYAEKLLAYHGLSVDLCIAYQDVQHHKPHPDGLLAAAKGLGVAPSQCLYIGDQPKDVQAAVAAGMLPIFVTWGKARLSRGDEQGLLARCDTWDTVFAAVVHYIETARPASRTPYHLRTLRARVEGSVWTPSDGTGTSPNFALFTYHPRHSPGENLITALVNDFKVSDPYAVKQVKKIFIEQFEQWMSLLRRELGCRYIMCVPPSRAGQQNAPCEQVAAALAHHYSSWLTYVPHALERTDTLPQSARAARGQRPTYAEHLDSIRYRRVGIRARGKGILLLDDVYTKGVTSRACRDLLVEAAGCAQVVGVFLSRTVGS